MLKQKMKTHPEKHFLYQQQKLLEEKPEPHPNPPTIPLLPLRPKNCMPRMMQQHIQTEPHITDAFESLQVCVLLVSSELMQQKYEKGQWLKI